MRRLVAIVLGPDDFAQVWARCFEGNEAVPTHMPVDHGGFALLCPAGPSGLTAAGCRA